MCDLCSGVHFLSHWASWLKQWKKGYSAWLQTRNVTRQKTKRYNFHNVDSWVCLLYGNNLNNNPCFVRNSLTWPLLFVEMPKSANISAVFAIIPWYLNHVCWERIHKKERVCMRECVSPRTFVVVITSFGASVVQKTILWFTLKWDWSTCPAPQLWFEQLRQIYCISIRAEERWPGVILKF